MSNTEKQLALIDRRSELFVPSLLKACRIAEKGKQHELLLEVFRGVDIKKDEISVYDSAKSHTVTKKVREKVMEEDENGVMKPIYKTFDKIVDSRNITHLIKKLGRAEVTLIIRVLLVNVNDAFNVKGLSEYQIKEIAEEIIEDYADILYIDELIYIFKKAKKDAKIFGKIDGSDIYGWLKEYDKAKMSQIYKRSHVDKHKDLIPTLAQDVAKKFTIPVGDINSIQKKGEKEKGSDKYFKRFTLRDQSNAGIDTSKIKITGYVKKDKKSK